ncbi:hypothetical protein H5410_000603 [Solanum commersonii]|uniref:Uncharacterized protein n=1 Tax=Solanum commersonii TaxID=4109 RepID=A0A9J6AWH8_SOLCO|nr:hypothetical protein H5410_000603 [Solanum commersonii]
MLAYQDTLLGDELLSDSLKYSRGFRQVVNMMNFLHENSVSDPPLIGTGYRLLSEGRENIQEGIVPFKWFDDNLSDCRFCRPLTLEGIGPVTELDEKCKNSSWPSKLLKDKNSSWPSKLLFASDNPQSFPNLKKSEIGPSRWL